MGYVTGPTGNRCFTIATGTWCHMSALNFLYLFGRVHIFGETNDVFLHWAQGPNRAAPMKGSVLERLFPHPLHRFSFLVRGKMADFYAGHQFSSYFCNVAHPLLIRYYRLLVKFVQVGDE